MSEESRRRLLAVARRVREQGPLRPLVVIEGADADEPAMFFDASPFWGNQTRRRQVMKSLGGTFGYGVDAQRIYVVVEMWVAEENLKGLTDAEFEAYRERFRRGDVVPPSERPDRKSAIQVLELTTTESPAGAIIQNFERRKGKLRWAEPRVWRTGERIEDFTFGAFWEGIRVTQEARDFLQPIADQVGLDDGEAEQTMRRAARRAAVNTFGADLFAEHEIGRVMRRWRSKK